MKTTTTQKEILQAVGAVLTAESDLQFLVRLWARLSRHRLEPVIMDAFGKCLAEASAPELEAAAAFCRQYILLHQKAP